MTARAAAAPGTGARPTPWGYLIAGVAGVALLILVGALGDSAATVGLGARTGTPPWDLAARPGSWVVTVLAGGGYLLGGFAVLRGLAAVADGWRPRPALVLAGTVVALVALTAVPPIGSADHLSYLAYGRIAAAGDDPYLVAPLTWHDGTDPVASAVQPPWQETPSVYGPVATAAQALVAWAGDGSLRRSVWWWQVLCAAAFAAVALLLDRVTRADPAARARAAVLWTWNPLLAGQLVLGAHLDVLAVAFGVGCVLLAARRPLLAGVLLGAAVGTKAPYALFGLAVLWGLRRAGPRQFARGLGLGTLGALAVWVPASLWAGPHLFDQLGVASQFTSLASPWRAVANLGGLFLGPDTVRPLLTPVALALAAALAVVFWRRRAGLHPVGGLAPAKGLDPSPGDAAVVTADAVRAAWALTVAWALTAPYALPWYDAMVWAPLALVGASSLDRLLLARLVVLALAYVPGRVVQLSWLVETVTLGLRRFVAPVLVLAVIVLVVRWVRSGPGTPGTPFGSLAVGAEPGGGRS